MIDLFSGVLKFSYWEFTMILCLSALLVKMFLNWSDRFDDKGELSEQEKLVSVSYFTISTVILFVIFSLLYKYFS